MTTIDAPDELAHEIDRLAGDEKRSAYAIAVLWKEVRRNGQIEAPRASAGSWKAEDHPELAGGGAASVDALRRERDERIGIGRGLEEAKRGEGRPMREFLEELAGEHGISLRANDIE